VRVIVAGSRRITSENLVFAILNSLKDQIPIMEVVCGQAPGVDTLGEVWAKKHFIPTTPFPADWNNIDAPGAIIRTSKYGRKYNARAGFDRNQKMAEYGQALILIWDGNSPGSADMLARAKALRLVIYQYIVYGNGQVERRLF
jgi:YspA, cpYpsA-related SLOG family